VGPAITGRLPSHATPLTVEEQEGLIPALQTRADLNEFEAANIDSATLWALGRGRRRAQRNVATLDGLLDLHRRMFDQTWSWAGQLRRTNKNLGVPKEQIRGDLKALCDDVIFQIAHASYPADELAVRFHHRLVSIHPFANGNGRLGRLAADILISRLGGEPFAWGGKSLDRSGSSRTTYIRALQDADTGQISSLLGFARSTAQPTG
jgi:Fic-DOC domain mobile mystery protein B